jgi:hypothetical protein
MSRYSKQALKWIYISLCTGFLPIFLVIIFVIFDGLFEIEMSAFYRLFLYSAFGVLIYSGPVLLLIGLVLLLFPKRREKIIGSLSLLAAISILGLFYGLFN